MLMDSTYLTLCGFPLSTLLAISFGGYGVPIAFMISTLEDTSAYLQLLNSLTTLRPDAIVVDKSDAEIKAIKEFARGGKPCPIVCYFHIIQAIKRNLSSSNLTGQEGQVVLSLIKSIHGARTQGQCDWLIGKLGRYLNERGKFVC